MLRALAHSRFIFLAATAMCLGCNRDYTVELPNHYFVARVYPGAFAVVNPQNHVLTEQSHDAIALAVVDDFVMGEIDPPSGPDSGLRAHRFFVINTRTNEAWLKLSQKDYLERLRMEAVKAPRRLVLVDRFVTLSTLRSAV